jgi:hypothetical protein
MKRLPIHWIALAVLWLTYTLLGWHLSAYHFIWLILSFLATALLNLSLTKEGREIGELFSFGPRSLITIFLLSTAVTLAVAASSVFALILILLAAELLARVELQVAGLDRSRAFWIMLLLASLGLGVGWWFGITLLPSSRYWIYG